MKLQRWIGSVSMQICFSIPMGLIVLSTLVCCEMKMDERSYGAPELVKWSSHGSIVKVIGIAWDNVKKTAKWVYCTGVLATHLFVLIPGNCTVYRNVKEAYSVPVQQWIVVIPWLSTVTPMQPAPHNWSVMATVWGAPDYSWQWSLHQLTDANLTVEDVCPRPPRIAHLPLRPNFLGSALLDLKPLSAGVKCWLVGFDASTDAMVSAKRMVESPDGSTSDLVFNGSVASSFIAANRWLRKMPVKLLAPLPRQEDSKYDAIWNVQYRSTPMAKEDIKIVDIGSPLVCNFPSTSESGYDDTSGEYVMGILEGFARSVSNGTQEVISQVENREQLFGAENGSEKAGEEWQLLLSLFVHSELEEFISRNHFPQFISGVAASYTECGYCG